MLAESAPGVHSRAGRAGNFLCGKGSKVERDEKDIPRGRKSKEKGEEVGPRGAPVPGLFPASLQTLSAGPLLASVSSISVLHFLFLSCDMCWTGGGQPRSSRCAEEALRWGERRDWLS